jgi:hypothetical protein
VTVNTDGTFTLDTKNTDLAKNPFEKVEIRLQKPSGYGQVVVISRLTVFACVEIGKIHFSSLHFGTIDFYRERCCLRFSRPYAKYDYAI